MSCPEINICVNAGENVLFLPSWFSEIVAWLISCDPNLAVIIYLHYFCSMFLFLSDTLGCRSC